MDAFWRGRRVWLVGASTGIGAACARELLARGARVALSARRGELLDALLAGTGGLALPLDATDAEALARAAERIRAAWGGIDLLIYAAGDYRPMRAWELDLPRARAMVDVNLGGALNALAAVLPAMFQARAGAVALVASVAGYRGLPNALPYGATKAALINLAETLRFDLEPRGLAVHLICPGFVRTPLTADNAFPMPALIEPEEAAREMLAGIARGDFHIHFPRRFTRVLNFLRLLPYGLYFPLLRRITGA